MSHVVAQERDSKEQINALTEKVNALKYSLPQRPLVIPKPPTAEEIALAVSKHLKDTQAPPSQSAGTNTATITPPVSSPIVVQPEAVQPPPAKPCRGDHLSECTDAQLLEWGRPLVEKVEAIEKEYVADTKNLEDIKSGWLGEFVGGFIGGGSDSASKRQKVMEIAQAKGSDQLRNCCAENLLTYLKELTLRNGGGVQEAKTNEWIQNLLKPEKSKEWKKARQDFIPNIYGLSADLSSLELKLKIDEIDRQRDAILTRMHGKH